MFDWKNFKAEERWIRIKHELCYGLFGFIACTIISIIFSSFIIFVWGCFALFIGIHIGRFVPDELDDILSGRPSISIGDGEILMFILGLFTLMGSAFMMPFFMENDTLLLLCIIGLGLSIIMLSFQIRSYKLQKSLETHNDWLLTVPGLFDSGQKFSIKGNKSFSSGKYSSALEDFTGALLKFEEARKGVIGLGSEAPVGIEVIDNCIATCKSNIKHCEIALDEEKVESLSKIAKDFLVESTKLRKQGELFKAREKATKADQTANDAFTITNQREFAKANRKLVALLEQIRDEFNMIDSGMAQGVASIELKETHIAETIYAPPTVMKHDKDIEGFLSKIVSITVPDYMDAGTTSEILVELNNTSTQTFTDISLDTSQLEEDFEVSGTVAVKTLSPGKALDQRLKIKPRYERGTFPVKITIIANGARVTREYSIKVGGTEIY
jgi:hypothetical protein